jgi:hypothetical protein
VLFLWFLIVWKEWEICERVRWNLHSMSKERVLFRGIFKRCGC